MDFYAGSTVTCGQCWVPDEREGVVEDEGWVPSGLTDVHQIGSVFIGHLQLHEFWYVECKGNGCDGDYVDQESFGVGHCLSDGPAG